MQAYSLHGSLGQGLCVCDWFPCVGVWLPPGRVLGEGDVVTGTPVWWVYHNGRKAMYD